MIELGKSNVRCTPLFFGVVGPVCALLMATSAIGGDYAAVYQSDFSADPGWVTDQPTNYYWDSGAGVYHATTVNAQPGATPTRYAYTLVNYGGGSLRFEFDINPTSLEWSAGVALGLFDASLALSPSTGIPNPHSIFVHPGRSDGGLSMPLYVRGLNGVSHAEHIGWNLFSEGVWYHCVVQYDQASDAASLTVTERSTGNPVGSAQVTNIGGFPSDMDYLGFARDPVGECCPPVGGGCSGYSCSASGTALLDNVRLTVPVCDDFEDGALNSAVWTWGGKTDRGVGAGSWQFSQEEFVGTDGYAKLRVWGPTSGNTHGAEAWIRTQYDYNDGSNHIINFRWGAEVNATHVDEYAIQITDGSIPGGQDVFWFGGATSIDGATWKNLYYMYLQPDMAPADWSMHIDGSQNTATLFGGPNLSGPVLGFKSLPDNQAWYVRFILSDATSAGFPAGDNLLTLYEFCSAVTTEAMPIPTVSQWGLIVMAGLVAAAGGSILHKRRMNA